MTLGCSKNASVVRRVAADGSCRHDGVRVFLRPQPSLPVSLLRFHAGTGVTGAAHARGRHVSSSTTRADAARGSCMQDAHNVAVCPRPPYETASLECIGRDGTYPAGCWPQPPTRCASNSFWSLARRGPTSGLPMPVCGRSRSSQALHDATCCRGTPHHAAPSCVCRSCSRSCAAHGSERDRTGSPSRSYWCSCHVQCSSSENGGVIFRTRQAPCIRTSCRSQTCC